MELGSVEKSQVIATKTYTTNTKYLESDFSYWNLRFVKYARFVDSMPPENKGLTIKRERKLQG